MSEFYTSIELGTNSIKIVVCEKFNDKYNILAKASYPSSGIERGFVVDIKSATNSVKGAINQINKMLGTELNKVIACIPPEECKFDILNGTCSVEDYNSISGKDVSNVFLATLKNHDFGDYELVTAMPINFIIDNDNNVSDPRGLRGSTLDARVVVASTPKEPLYRILSVLKLAGLEVVDICYSSFGDYYALSNKDDNNMVGAIINIGEESTNISIFNRGIQIKNGVIFLGSKTVDKDLSYVFRTKMDESRDIKEHFAVALSSYADNNDKWNIKIDDENSKDINQLGVSKVVEARIKEILKLAKNEIKNLTNREIRYIIITGGLSELAGFQYLVEHEFGFIARVGNITNIGIRNNIYSSSFGIIKFFNDKLNLRDKHYNMFSSEEIEKIRSI